MERIDLPAIRQRFDNHQSTREDMRQMLLVVDAHGDDIEEMMTRAKNAEAGVERLKKVLRWYANPGRYEIHGACFDEGDKWFTKDDLLKDGGQRARTALATPAKQRAPEREAP